MRAVLFTFVIAFALLGCHASPTTTVGLHFEVNVPADVPAPSRDIYLQAHRAGWDEAIANFLSGAQLAVEPPRTLGRAVSGLEMDARYTGYRQCMNAIRALLLRHGDDTLREQLTPAGRYVAYQRRYDLADFLPVGLAEERIEVITSNIADRVQRTEQESNWEAHGGTLWSVRNPFPGVLVVTAPASVQDITSKLVATAVAAE